MSVSDDIKAGMAKAFFASAYAEQYDEAAESRQEMPFNPSGCDWIDLASEHPIDPAAEHAATTLAMGLESANKMTLEALYEHVEGLYERADNQGDRDLDPDLFGHYCAMQAMGTGVGLESFGDDVHDAVQVPYVEFGGYSLEKDYFTSTESDE